MLSQNVGKKLPLLTVLIDQNCAVLICFVAEARNHELCPSYILVHLSTSIRIYHCVDKNVWRKDMFKFHILNN